jgi:hypothetical protein
MNWFSKLTGIFSTMNKHGLCIIYLLFSVAGAGQPTLPHFAIQSTKQKNIKLSWRNPYRNCVQLLIQRSIDNQKTFNTIRSATHPDMPENDFIDKKIPVNKIPYYRISYTLRGGKTFFTAAQSLQDKKNGLAHIVEEPRKQIITAPKPSYVMVHPKGYVIIHVPELIKHRYHLIIYDADGSILFDIPEIKQPSLILEKGNFLRAGCFSYTLFEDDQPLEKSKFCLQAEEYP